MIATTTKTTAQLAIGDVVLTGSRKPTFGYVGRANARTASSSRRVALVLEDGHRVRFTTGEWSETVDASSAWLVTAISQA